jgi:signal transduction histidine kinase
MMLGRPVRTYDRLVTPTAWGQALTARAAAWYAALPPKRRERAQDTGLAAGLAVLSLLSLVPYQSQLHPAWLAFFLLAVQCVPLAWRRDWPVPVLILTGWPGVLYAVLGLPYAPLPLAIAIAFATVIDRSGPVLRWLSVVGIVTGSGIAQAAPGHHQPYDAIVQVFIFGTAWAIGMLSRSRRVVIATASQRAERAEAELDAAAAQAADAERVRIARELHDVVAHHVSLMAVQAEATGALLPGRPEEASRSADQIGQTARQALAELRRLLGVLRSPANYPERTVLTPAASLSRLEEVLDQVRDSGLAVSLSVTGERAPLAPGIDLTAYRIVQEALTNAIRHAPGSRASVGICYADGSVTIDVRDTGAAAVPVPAQGDRSPARGDLSQARPDLSHGFGLAGIAERVASCGGMLTVGPVAPAGFAVTARLPVR